MTSEADDRRWEDDYMWILNGILPLSAHPDRGTFPDQAGSALLVDDDHAGRGQARASLTLSLCSRVGDEPVTKAAKDVALRTRIG